MSCIGIDIGQQNAGKHSCHTSNSGTLRLPVCMGGFSGKECNISFQSGPLHDVLPGLTLSRYGTQPNP